MKMTTEEAFIKVFQMHGLDCWPAKAAIIQIDINPDRIGLTKPVAVAGINIADICPQN